MKKVSPLLILVIFTLTACTDSNEVKLSSQSSSAKEVHESANDFAEAVGRKLKAQYPSRIVEVSVKLTATDSELPVDFAHLNLEWYAKIEPSDTAQADYYFDRRGTLLSGSSPIDAIEAVQKEIGLSNKVQIMIDQFDRVYGNHKMPKSFITQAVASQIKDGKKKYWCLEEYFCTAKKE